jgi:hypothetical protein
MIGEHAVRELSWGYGHRSITVSQWEALVVGWQAPASTSHHIAHELAMRPTIFFAFGCLELKALRRREGTSRLGRMM